MDVGITTFPFLPEQSTYSYGKTTGIVSTRLDGGLSKLRLDSLGETSIVSCQWILNSLEYEYFIAFYNAIAGRGTVPFQTQLILDTPEVEVFRALFVPDSIVVTPLGGNTYRLNAELEVEPIESSGNDLSRLLELRKELNFSNGLVPYYYFDGANDYVDHPLIELTGDYSLSMWVWRNTKTEFCLLGGGDSAGGATYQGFLKWDQANQRWAINNNGGIGVGVLGTSAIELPNKEWKHISLTRSGLTLKLYYNGVQVATSTIGSAATLSLRRFGQSFSSVFQFLGKMRYYSIYDKALSLSEVEYEYTGGLLGTSPGTSNLKALYSMGEGGGTICYDLSGNDLHGSIENADEARFHNSEDVENATEPPTVYEFQDLNTYVAHTAIALTGDYTLSAWVSRTGEHTFALFGGGDQALGAAYRAYFWWDNTNNRWQVNNDGGIGVGILGNIAHKLADGVWKFVSLTRAGVSLKLYFDGVLQASATIGSAATFTVRNFGQSHSSIYQFYGKMWGHSIYNRALTASELEYLFTAGVSGTNPTTTNLQASYPMGEGRGLLSCDISGQGRHGTIVGADQDTFHVSGP